MNLRLLICDLDGTLVDSFRDIAASCNLLLASIGAQPLPDAEIRPCIGRGVEFLVSGILSAAGHTPSDAGPLLVRYRAIYREHALDATQLYPGVRETLNVLSDSAALDFRLAVVSNKPELATREILEAFGIADHFHLIAGGDTFEEMKPSPVPLKKVMESMGVNAGECAIIGDSVYDLEAGKAAGMYTIAALYGFQSAEKLKALEPDQAVSAFGEILQIIHSSERKL
ncbi:MAG: HAD-IA family hydrolase [Bacteroidota bacterium]